MLSEFLLFAAGGGLTGAAISSFYFVPKVTRLRKTVKTLSTEIGDVECSAPEPLALLAPEPTREISPYVNPADPYSAPPPDLLPQVRDALHLSIIEVVGALGDGATFERRQELKCLVATLKGLE